MVPLNAHLKVLKFRSSLVLPIDWGLGFGDASTKLPNTFGFLHGPRTES